MEMIELRILGVIIGLVTLYMTHLYFKRKIFNKGESTFWFTLWFGFLVILIRPKLFDFILVKFDLERTADIIIIVAFIVIYVIGFYNYINQKILYEKLEALVRANALKDLDQK